MSYRLAALSLMVLVILALACGADKKVTPTRSSQQCGPSSLPCTTTQTPAPISSHGDPILIGAGDSTSCHNNNAEATAELLDQAFSSGTSGRVFTAGDNAYDDGSPSEYSDCYDPSWGRHKARTMPAPGNHDYHTDGAAGYFGYFGAAAGDPDKGYYSYDLAGWHTVVINTSDHCKFVSCRVGSPQEQWLRSDLAAHPATCTVAIWHEPRFSSGSTHGSAGYLQPIWQALYDYGADVVINGHEHNYERFAPQTPTGNLDMAKGIREFVVGTGGHGLYGFGERLSNSEVRSPDTYGVLKLTLHSNSYDWEFLPVAGKTFTDSGHETCH